MERVTLSGEVQTFLDALGSPTERPEALGRAIGLVGPGLEVEAFEQDGVTNEHRHFRRTGAGFLLHGGDVVAIVLPVIRDGGPVYGAVDALIDGVDPSLERSEIVSAIGTPTRSSQRMDLWRMGGRYLRLDYAGDRLTDVSTALSGVEL